MDVNDDFASALAGDPGPPASTALVQTRIALEVAQFNVAMPRLEGEMHRSAQGFGETKVLFREHAGLRVITVDMGFPVVGRVHNGSGLITMALALEVPSSRSAAVSVASPPSAEDSYCAPPGQISSRWARPPTSWKKAPKASQIVRRGRWPCCSSSSTASMIAMTLLLSSSAPRPQM